MYRLFVLPFADVLAAVAVCYDAGSGADEEEGGKVEAVEDVEDVEDVKEEAKLRPRKGSRNGKSGRERKNVTTERRRRRSS
jgi:hypothetical protein